MWLAFLAVWVALTAVILVRRPGAVINPTFWMGIGWLLVLGLYYTSGYVYRYPVKLSGLLYFSFIFLGFLFGFGFGKRNVFIFGHRGYKRRRLMPSMTDTQLNEFNYKVFSLIAFAGVVVFLFDFITHNSLILSNDLHTNSTMTGLGVLGKIAAFIGIVVWLYDLNFSVNNNVKVKPYAYLCALFYLIPGLLTAGRQSILIFLVSTFVIFWISIRNNRNYLYKGRFVFVGILIMAVLLFYTTIVASSRTIVASKVALFEYIFNCKIPNETLNQLDKTGPLKTFFLEILSYYSHELPNFQVLFDNWDLGLRWGASQFQLISQNLPEGSYLSYSSVWSGIEQLSNNAGIYSHTWRTIAGNCLIDFGIVGGIIYMWICGYIAARVHTKAMENETTMDHVLLALINAGAFFCIQFSPFSEVSWYYPIIWLIVGIPIIVQFFRGKK